MTTNAGTDAAEARPSAGARILMLLIGGYRRFISPMTGPHCRFVPSCSAYALNAASKELLQRLRSWPDEQQATPVVRMEVHGDEGGELVFRAQDQQAPALAKVAIPWAEARRRIHAAARRRSRS